MSKQVTRQRLTSLLVRQGVPLGTAQLEADRRFRLARERADQVAAFSARVQRSSAAFVSLTTQHGSVPTISKLAHTLMRQNRGLDLGRAQLRAEQMLRGGPAKRPATVEQGLFRLALKDGSNVPDAQNFARAVLNKSRRGGGFGGAGAPA